MYQVLQINLPYNMYNLSNKKPYYMYSIYNVYKGVSNISTSKHACGAVDSGSAVNRYSTTAIDTVVTGGDVYGYCGSWVEGGRWWVSSPNGMVAPLCPYTPKKFPPQTRISWI